jgi:hypothetical protein
MGVLVDDLCELVACLGFVEEWLCERASVLGKRGNDGYGLVEDSGLLVEVLCSLAEAMNLGFRGSLLAPPGAVQARTGAVQARTGAVQARTGAVQARTGVVQARTGTRRTPS